MYQDSLEEVNQVRGQYEARLVEANDRFRVVKAENEELKEKVDVLFKLVRSYINRKENSDNNKEKTEKKEKTSNNKEDNIETETIEDVIDDEDLSSWTQNKMRGFKRTGPASPSARSDPKNSPPKNSTPTGTGIPVAPSQTNITNGHPTTSSNTNPQTQQETDSRWSVGGRKQYCHYFVNQGRCNYEERTGEKCKFVHEQAPMCKSGLGCNRNKCMYAHPNIGGNRNMNNTNCLEQTRGPQQIMNPWQIINPWMNPSTFQHLQNPWSMPGNQTKQ